ncbi:hypothetical protein PR048_019235 [Dryococelus australis]|uniref:FERM N-terminal domain-containing protein n=1 Tax=Dryococelus australis TaxID=614101 RepID=A0ABQ9H322_9NEOP|nr:hypothetical protein PR048_019235 [Dryococelus australis]
MNMAGQWECTTESLAEGRVIECLRVSRGERSVARAARINVRASELARDRRLKTLGVVVHFLDDTQHTFQVEKRSKGNALLEMVFQHLELIEKDYFGLQFSDNGMAPVPGNSDNMSTEGRFSHPARSRQTSLRDITPPTPAQTWAGRPHYKSSSPELFCAGALLHTRSSGSSVTTSGCHHQLPEAPTINCLSKALELRKPARLHSTLTGAMVSERLACSPPTKVIRVQFPTGSLGIFVCGNRAGQCCWLVFSGISHFPHPSIPVLLHTHLNHPHRLSRPQC